MSAAYWIDLGWHLIFGGFVGYTFSLVRELLGRVRIVEHLQLSLHAMKVMEVAYAERASGEACSGCGTFSAHTEECPVTLAKRHVDDVIRKKGEIKE